jgi:hypothetical protein
MALPPTMAPDLLWDEGVDSVMNELLQFTGNAGSLDLGGPENLSDLQGFLGGSATGGRQTQGWELRPENQCNSSAELTGGYLRTITTEALPVAGPLNSRELAAAHLQHAYLQSSSVSAACVVCCCHVVMSP